MPYIGLLDVSGIQDYLFRSPRLRHIAAASERIERLSGPEGLFAAAATGSVRLHVGAGGIAVYTASCEGDLQSTFRAVSRELLEKGHGLEVVGAICAYQDGALGRTYRWQAVPALERNKLTQPRSTRFVFSGLTDPRRRSDQGAGAPAGGGPLIDPLELDEMICTGGWVRDGRDAESSVERTGLMAVVSVDGLGMGRKLLEWLSSAEHLADEAFVSQFHSWSEHVKAVWHDAWSATCRLVDGLFPEPEYRHRHPYQHDRYIELHKACVTSGKGAPQRYRPYRRVYQGGDDLSFVCDARIALGMTAALVRGLQLRSGTSEPQVPEAFRTMAVSAGVVFVDSHFPFSRAVRMAGEVRQSAKMKAMEHDHDRPSSHLDWWLNRQGALWREERRFSVKPVPLVGEGYALGEVDWQAMEQTVLAGMWEQFGDKRNKLKDLVAAAEDGPETVRDLLKTRPLPEKQLCCLPTGFDSESGFWQERCTPLIDAGELFDIHFPFAAAGEAAQGTEAPDARNAAH
ncbi:MAG: hypothetical protein AB1505_26685 [Candidatus Latescibacterota bacterium]